MLLRSCDRRFQGAEAVFLESAVRVYEEQYCPAGNSNPAIPGGRNSRVRLPDDIQLDPVWWEAARPFPNLCRGRFVTTVVHYDDFKIECIGLLREGIQTYGKGLPVVIDSYDNAETRHRWVQDGTVNIEITV